MFFFSFREKLFSGVSNARHYNIIIFYGLQALFAFLREKFWVMTGCHLLQAAEKMTICHL